MLEKLLEEIEEQKHIVEIFGRGAYFVPLETVKAIIRKHMNDGWILVEERLPENAHSVLICGITGWVDVGWREQDHWWTGFSHADIQKDVIAWMPLPEPYRPDKEYHNGENKN